MTYGENGPDGVPGGGDADGGAVPGTGAPAPTLETVAEAAGVSRATVSRVVNNSPKVSPEVRALVEETVARLGYVPNRAARSLVTRKTDSVALVISEPDSKVFKDPLLAAAVMATGQALADTDKQLVLLMVKDERDRMRTANYLTGGHVEGVILVSMHDRDPLPRILRDSGIPAVQMARPQPTAPLPYVDVDNVDGARKAVRHLVSTGRTRIASIAGPADMVAAVDRLTGFVEELEASGLSAHRFVHGDFSQSSGEQAMIRLLAEHPELDAVFSASDLMAAGALRTLRRRGRSVPGDVAVVGFDDLDVAVLTEPPLSTVSQPVDAMARAMVSLLLAEIAGEPHAQQVILPTRLVLRASA
jgi:DNA-binding LacI/PurR family transcriptional regulator